MDRFFGLLASLVSVHWGFIARISKGRTIKEFLITTIFIPTIASVIWFSIFANTAFDIISTGDSTQFNPIFSSLFFFRAFSFSFYHLYCWIIGSYLLSTVDSAIFVLGMFSDNGNENPSGIN
jgi:glycine betaine transporter